MAFDLMQSALDFMSAYGLIAIFVLLVLDSAMLLPAVPGEIILILAVAHYGDGVDGFLLVFFLAVVAAMVGAVLLYWLGRWRSPKPGEERRVLLGMSPERQQKLERLFSRPLGQGVLFVGRLFPLTRIVVSLPAGLARMPFLRFFLVSVAGTAIFYAGFLWLTYEFNDPSSPIGLTAAGVRAAYATPAMDLVEANWIITGGLVALFGIFLSMRGSIRMARDHKQSGRTLFGSVMTHALLWGGIILVVAASLDPPLVVRLLALGGVSPAALEPGLPGEPLTTLILFASFLIATALFTRWIRSSAEERNRILADVADSVVFEQIPQVEFEAVPDMVVVDDARDVAAPPPIDPGREPGASPSGTP